MKTMLYLAAAILPAVVLLTYIYRKDTVEKEPSELLVKCLLAGAVVTIPATALEYLGGLLINALTISSNEVLACITALSVGFIEEGVKFCALKKLTWNRPEMNELFDGMVYAAFVSLGFAALENILYVFTMGISVALGRALLSVPAHFCFAIITGLYYGRAKKYDIYGDNQAASFSMLKGFLLAVLLHGAFDGTLMIGTDASMVLFVVLVAVMYISVYIQIRMEKKKEQRIF